MSKKKLLILIEAIINMEEMVTQHSKYANANYEDICPEFHEILYDVSLSIKTNFTLLCIK